MKVLEKRSYLGPNLYANFRVNRLTLDIEQLEEHRREARLGGGRVRLGEAQFSQG